MQTHRHSMAKSKILYGVIFLSLLFSAIGTRNWTPAQAQASTTNTPMSDNQLQAVNTPIPEHPQIVGGGLADPGEYPWQVEISIYDPTVSGYYLCGGSLINVQWVLTAAHCITQNNGSVSLAAYIAVYAGEYDRTGIYGYTYRGVSQVIRHPAYNSITVDNDIALLNLSSPVTVGNGSNPPYTKIDTISPVSASVGSLAGVNAWVTGWGLTSYGGNTSDQLREVQLPIMDSSVCNDGNHWSGQITSNMLCAGYDNGTKSTCSGDSGGPLVVWNAATGEWNLAGVTSFGPLGCSVPYLPSVFTRVSQYQSWLSSYLPSATLTLGITGNGTITSNPSGINCPADCTEPYSYNTTVILTATPATGYMFSGWSGACSGTGSCTVTMTDAKSVGATFIVKLFNDVSKGTSSFDLSHGWTVSDYARTMGDVNGDGRADLVGFGLDGVYVALALNPGPGFDTISKWTSAFDLSHGWTVKDYVRTVGDVNGDGRADLVGFGLDGVYVALALNPGPGFEAVSKWTSAFDLSHGWTVKDYVRTMGDVNGDGRADLVGFGLDGVYVALALNPGPGFEAVSKWTSSFDLSHGWTVKDYVRTVSDVNGDNRDDLIGFGQDGVYVALALNPGPGFDAISKWTNAFDLSHGWTVSQYVRTVGDVNADGLSDLIGFGQNGVYIALSSGGGFNTISLWTNDFDLSHGWTVKDYVRTVGDINADGKADLVGFGLDGVYVSTAK